MRARSDRHESNQQPEGAADAVQSWLMLAPPSSACRIRRRTSAAWGIPLCNWDRCIVAAALLRRASGGAGAWLARSASSGRSPPARRPAPSADPAWSAGNPGRKACLREIRIADRAGFRRSPPCARRDARTEKPARASGRSLVRTDRMKTSTPMVRMDARRIIIDRGSAIPSRSGRCSALVENRSPATGLGTARAADEPDHGDRRPAPGSGTAPAIRTCSGSPR